MPAFNVTTSAAVVVPANDGRNGVILQNISDTDVFVGASSVTAAFGANAGLRIAANGGSLSLSRSFPGDRAICGALFCVHAGSGNKEVRYLEL
jgi:hypothetical protein